MTKHANSELDEYIRSQQWLDDRVLVALDGGVSLNEALREFPPFDTYTSGPNVRGPAQTSSDRAQLRASRRQRPTRFDAEQLMSMTLPTPTWVVPGIVPEGLTILAGKPKVGKSWFALELAYAISMGREFLGRRLDKGSVLYLALEDTAPRLRRRLTKVADARVHLEDWWRARTLLKEYGAEALADWLGVEVAEVEDARREDLMRRDSDVAEDKPSAFNDLITRVCAEPDVVDWLSFLTTAPRFPSAEETIVQWFNEEVAIGGYPRLVIVDTYAKVRQDAAEPGYSYIDDYRAMDALKHIADEGLPVLVIDHERKADAEDVLDKVTGTTGKTGSADTILALSKSGEARKLQGRGRDLEDDISLDLFFNADTARFEVFDLADLHGMTPERPEFAEWVMTLVSSEGQVPSRDELTGSGLFSQDEVERGLKRLRGDPRFTSKSPRSPLFLGK